MPSIATILAAATAITVLAVPAMAQDALPDLAGREIGQALQGLGRAAGRIEDVGVQLRQPVRSDLELVRSEVAIEPRPQPLLAAAPLELLAHHMQRHGR